MLVVVAGAKLPAGHLLLSAFDHGSRSRLIAKFISRARRPLIYTVL